MESKSKNNTCVVMIMIVAKILHSIEEQETECVRSMNRRTSKYQMMLYERR